MSWQNEISIITRVWINDISDSPVYSDERLLQLITVAAKYVQFEIDLKNKYNIDIINSQISPDPVDIKDDAFISFVSLKSACLLDQSTFRIKAANEGVKAALGPASLWINGNSTAYETILNKGPCFMYDQLKTEYEIGNASVFEAIIGPFRGNKFDPDLQRSQEAYSQRGGFFY